MFSLCHRFTMWAPPTPSPFTRGVIKILPEAGVLNENGAEVHQNQMSETSFWCSMWEKSLVCMTDNVTCCSAITLSCILSVHRCPTAHLLATDDTNLDLRVKSQYIPLALHLNNSGLPYPPPPPPTCFMLSLTFLLLSDLECYVIYYNDANDAGDR